MSRFLVEPCGAKTRGGTPCRRAPTPGRARCRLHGGASREGIASGNWVDGRTSIVVARAKEKLRTLTLSEVDSPLTDQLDTLQAAFHTLTAQSWGQVHVADRPHLLRLIDATYKSADAVRRSILRNRSYLTLAETLALSTRLAHAIVDVLTTDEQCKQVGSALEGLLRSVPPSNASLAAQIDWLTTESELYPDLVDLPLRERAYGLALADMRRKVNEAHEKFDRLLSEVTPYADVRRLIAGFRQAIDTALGTSPEGDAARHALQKELAAPDLFLSTRRGTSELTLEDARRVALGLPVFTQPRATDAAHPRTTPDDQEHLTDADPAT